MSGTLDPQLQHTLKKRHLSMIAIAGVIGAGLFVGSGAAIRETGPGVVLAYALAGLVVVLVMRMLGEMSTANPDTGSFSAYADRSIGRWAGFSIGWLYAWFWILVLGIEATAGALIMNRWIPEVPQWSWALIMMIVLTLTNIVSVRSFGEFEFWFASIKVAAISIFIVLGVVAIFGFLPGVEAPGLSNLTGHGGLFPNGAGAVFAAILVVVFSFFGAEIATIAAGESANPVAAVRSAVRTVVWRILIFYIGSIAIVVTLLPWNDASVALSPYVAVIDSFGIPAAANIMDFIVLTSVLSCLNSGLYTASRMIFSLSRRGDAPPVLGKISTSGVPRVAVLVSTIVGFLTVVLNYLYPDTVFLFLVNSSGAIALFVWLTICVSQLRMRRQFESEGRELKLKMWLFPYLTWATIAAIVILCVGMLVIPDTRSQMYVSLALAIVVVGLGVYNDRYGAHKGKPGATEFETVSIDSPSR
ncbi:amino acid permease [Rhodococcus sp. NPDC049939]|uniref:amino acid permease n=1 Tax=Rhodococcus sp. NPDC049939 TaxID=3155511 RepID=UPI0033ED4893